MKRWKKMFVSLLTICMLFGMMSMSASAADPYTYTVKLFGGNKGTVNGGDVVTITDLAQNDNVDFTSVDVQVTDEKYYAKGIRLSGRNNDDVVFSSPAFAVDGDADYVVAYGITANRVAYTVNYQDAAGNTLAPSNTYYGDIGDRPVIAYLYIDGYIPQALAMTGTLTANAADNVFTFTYTPGESDTVITNTNTVTVPGTVTTVTAGTPAAAAAAPAADAAAVAPAADAGTAAPAEANAAAVEAADNPGGVVENADEATPQALVDTDEETPAADIDADSGKNFPMLAAVGIGVAALLALGILVFLYLKKHQIKDIDE